MDQAPQLLPQLNLSEQQQAVLHAHIQDAVTHMVGLTFTQEHQVSGMLQHAYYKGKMQAYLDLLAFDQQTLTTVQEN